METKQTHFSFNTWTRVESWSHKFLEWTRRVKRQPYLAEPSSPSELTPPAHVHPGSCGIFLPRDLKINKQKWHSGLLHLKQVQPVTEVALQTAPSKVDVTDKATWLKLYLLLHFSLIRSQKGVVRHKGETEEAGKVKQSQRKLMQGNKKWWTTSLIPSEHHGWIKAHLWWLKQLKTMLQRICMTQSKKTGGGRISNKRLNNNLVYQITVFRNCVID